MSALAVYVIVYLIAFGLVALSITIPSVGFIVMLAGALMGWRLITFLQPAMFVWMPLMGWVIYIIIKFIISAFIGTFILVPKRLAEKIIDVLSE